MIAKLDDFCFPVVMQSDGSYAIISHVPYPGFEQYGSVWLKPVDPHSCQNVWFTVRADVQEARVENVRQDVMHLIAVPFDGCREAGWNVNADGDAERYMKLPETGYVMHKMVFGAGKDHEVVPMDRRAFLDMWCRTRAPMGDIVLVRWICTQIGIGFDEGRRLLDRYQRHFGLYRELCTVYAWGGIPEGYARYKAVHWGTTGIVRFFPELPPLAVMNLLLLLTEDPDGARVWMEEADRRERRGFDWHEIEALLRGEGVPEPMRQRGKEWLLKEFEVSGYYIDDMRYRWLGICTDDQDRSWPGSAFVYTDETGSWFVENDPERQCMLHRHRLDSEDAALDYALYQMQHGNFAERSRLRQESVEERLRSERYV